VRRGGPGGESAVHARGRAAGRLSALGRRWARGCGESCVGPADNSPSVSGLMDVEPPYGEHLPGLRSEGRRTVCGKRQLKTAAVTGAAAAGGPCHDEPSGVFGRGCPPHRGVLNPRCLQTAVCHSCLQLSVCVCTPCDD